MPAFVKLIQGSFHQGNERFGSTAGKQCTCCALFSLTLSVVKNPGSWDKRDIDYIVESGDQNLKVVLFSHGTPVTLALHRPWQIDVLDVCNSFEQMSLSEGRRHQYFEEIPLCWDCWMIYLHPQEELHPFCSFRTLISWRGLLESYCVILLITVFLNDVITLDDVIQMTSNFAIANRF